VIVIVAAVAGGVTGRSVFRPRHRVVQPIPFNHAIHVDGEGLECTQCHHYVETGAHSGLPTLDDCLECHEEEELAEFGSVASLDDLERVSTIEGDVFRKLFRLPDHTFYSHRTHVALAGIECATCHGAIAASETPPENPLQRISMEFCIDCHLREGVSTDCTRCHR